MPEIRDPVHGPIGLTRGELAVVDSVVYQRLRNVKQLGFAEMVFPGATHNRYLHGLGAMHLAGRAFDSVFEDASWLQGAERARMRQTVRLAALLHDVGHPPLSHTLESILSPLSEVPLEHAGPCPERQATHEDMTLTLITESVLTGIINEVFSDMGVTAAMVAGLIDRDYPTDVDAYRVDGVDLRPILSQLVSSELDVDRMDYLLRDSYYTGATYGKYDLDWLISSLTHHRVEGGGVNLALRGRAIYTFEDFLLSRFHMFLMVYLHHRANAYDRMLHRFFDELEPSIVLPGDPEGYLQYDDSRIYAILREHRDNSWATRILERRPLRRLFDLEGSSASQLQAPLEAAFAAEGIATEWITSKSVLSKYYGRRTDPLGRIFVVEPRIGEPGKAIPLEEATELFQRYRDPTVFARLYTMPEDEERAKAISQRVFQERD